MRKILKATCICLAIVLCGCSAQSDTKTEDKKENKTETIKEVSITGQSKTPPYSSETNIVLKHDGTNVIEETKESKIYDFQKEDTDLYFNPIVNDLKATKEAFNQYDGFNLEYTVDKTKKIVTSTLKIDYSVFPVEAYIKYTNDKTITDSYKVNLKETLAYYKNVSEYTVKE